MNATHDVDRIWTFDDVKPEVRAAAPKLRAWLLARHEAPAKLLTGRRCDAYASQDEMETLEQEIIRRFAPLREAVHYLRALGIAVDHWNTQQSEDNAMLLCPPRIPILLKREPSPFRPGRMPSLARPRAWREAVARNGGAVRELSTQQAVGRILASAALNGGLLDPSTLSALLERLADPIVVVGERAEIELRLAWRGQPDMERRRWAPDPLTELLILGLGEDHRRVLEHELSRARTGTKAVWRCIAGYFRATFDDKEERPMNITDFLEPIVLELHAHVPVFIAGYAARRFVSHSLKDYVWQRLHGVPVPADRQKEDSAPAEPAAAADSQPEQFDDTGDAPFEVRGLSDIRRALSSGDKTKARAALARLKNDAGAARNPMISLLIEWAEFLLTQGSKIGNRLALSTIRSYVGRIGACLAGQVADRDIATLGTEALEEFYLQILEGAGSHEQRRFFGRGLREFHHFLVQCHHADPVDEREILGLGTALAPVDANLISLDEYYAILKRLDEIDLDLSHPDLATVVKLIFIISFRCGLRRMETLKLEIADLHEADPAVLLVRPHAHRSLKTKSATRKLPLDAFLEPEELALLKAWKKKRLEQLKARREDGVPFLFGIPEKAYAYVPEELVFPLLHRVMREVTGDPTLRFHHLRHSFASWTMLRLFLSDLPHTPPLFPHLPRTEAFLRASGDFRARLYGNANPTRKHLYAVASLLGHSGPDISLAHYIHFCDLALSLALGARPQTAYSTLVEVCNYPPSTAYRWHTQSDVSALLRAARMRAGKRVRWIRPQRRKAIRSTPIPTKEPKQQLALGTIERVWKYLYLRSAREANRAELAERFALSVAQAQAIEARAGVIRDLKVRESGQLYRHRMREEALDRADPTNRKRLLCPRRPLLSQDRAVLETYAPCFWALLDSEPALCRRVLDYFVRNAWSTRNELVFRDPARPDEAKDYLLFLKKLGIPREDIRFVTYDQKERSRHLAQWKEAGVVTWRDKVVRLVPPNKRSPATARWLGIKPVFMRAKAESEEGSYGFRFLLTMAAVFLASL